jgi:methyl-accepting chemotaxis protein
MKRVNEILLALLLAWLIVLLVFLFLWALKEKPLIHNALWNFSSSSYDVKQNSARELIETNKVLAGTKDLIEHTDFSLNGTREHPGAIPQLTTLVKKAQPVADNVASVTAHLDLAIQHTDAAIGSLNALLASGSATMAEVQASVNRVNNLIVALQGQVQDPSIKIALDNLAASGKAMADGMQQLAAASTDVRQIADKARETYLKPVNLWWGLVKELLPLAGSAAQVVK